MAGARPDPEQRAVVEFGEGAAHRRPRFPGPLGDNTAGRVVVVLRRTPSCRRHDGLIPVVGVAFKVTSDMELHVVDVTLVMTDCPFEALFGPDGIGPPEPHDTRTDRDPKSSGFRFDTRRSEPEHRVCRSNNAAAAVTISGLGNRSPKASIARSSPVAIPSATGSRTFFGTYLQARSAAGRPVASNAVAVRPNAVALPPSGLAASGARDLQVAALPAEPSWAGGCSADDCDPRVERVDPVADDATLGIGVPAPQGRRGCPQRRRQRGRSWSGVQAPCPVYVRSPDRLQ